MAVRKGLHVSEYGVLDDSTGETTACQSEDEVYGLLGLGYIEPELRENRGELEAAATGSLPELIELGDLRGDLHCHTIASDGTASIEQMAQAALDAGYEYLAITDHSATMGFGNEVSPEQLRDQIASIRAARVSGIELLAGSEVNILPDGSLDYDDELLAAARLGDRERPLLVPDAGCGDDRSGSSGRSSTRWSTRSVTCRAARSSAGRHISSTPSG